MQGLETAKTGADLPAKKAMTRLGMSEEDFLSLLLKKSLLAYRFHGVMPLDVAGLLEDKRLGTFKRRLWESPKGKQLRERNVPGWLDPYNEDFGGPIGREMFLQKGQQMFGINSGFEHADVPPLDAQMISEVLGALFFMEADVAAYERGLSAPVPTPEPDNQYDEMTTNDGEVLRVQRETPVEQARYSFVNEGPTWVLIYAGKRTAGLTQKGFAVIHYLVSNQRKAFTPAELQQEFDPAGADAVKAHGDIDYDAVYDNTAIKQITNRRQELQTELREAEESFDLEKKERLQEEIDGIEKLALSKIGLSHRSRKFVNEDTRNQDRYAKQIRRALDELENRDKTAYKHLHDSLKPINSSTFRYNPVDEIDWFLG